MFTLITTDKVNQQFPQTYENYATGVNQLKRILLPDSTIVYLNANSSLEVPRLFNERTERKVRMTGEAFFEVTKDPKRPFKIEVEELQVKVLGTSFNVKAYRQLKNITVAVVKGKVNVNKDAKVLSTLIPNQELTFNRETHTYEILNIQANENDWRNGVIVLNKSSFKDLDIAFFNTYGIHLATKDEKLLSERYNLTIRSSRTEEQTLKQLCEILDKKYRKEDKTVIIY